jgi:glutamate/tyrosine decarboxylase-like PLP-dependent enzyme
MAPKLQRYNQNCDRGATMPRKPPLPEPGASPRPEDSEHACCAEGQSGEPTPKWAKYREQMASEFPSPYRGVTDPLAREIERFVAKLDQLRPEPGGPAFLGQDSALAYSYPEVKQVAISQAMGDLDQVLDDVVNLFQGAPNWASPLTMCNVNPQGNTAAVIASMLAQVFAANILEGEYCWNVHRAELETAGMIGNLFGWDPLNTGAIYTYGGGGCWTYGLKYGLTRVLPDSRKKGVRTDAKVICSQQAHFVQQNASDWTGLGMDNIVHVRTDPATNQMDLAHLEEILADLGARGLPVATVVCTMGTTDAGAFDPIAAVRTILDRHPNPPGFGKAVLYADAVVGWSWIYFKDYDFDRNPLGFSARVLPVLRQSGLAMRELACADAVGIDFHKAGWAPYVSSCFLYRDAAEFETLLRRGEDAYLQARTDYNPMYYTLEVSRTASGSLAGWATLKYFGIEGMQAILGGILETKFVLRDLINRHEDLVCVNPEDSALVTLFRVYPRGIDADVQFAAELNDPGFREDLLRHNRLTETVGDLLFKWYRSGTRIDGRYTPHLSLTTGFRNTAYNRDGAAPEAVVYALKSFPMNVFVTPEDMRWALHCVLAARDAVLHAEAVDA